MKKIFLLEKYFRKFVPIYIFARYVFVKIFLGFYFESEAVGFKYFKKKKNLTIIDIGANDGLSTNFFLKNFNNSKIIVFEPIKNIVNVHYKKYNRNQLRIINCALGNKNKDGFLFIPYTYFFFFKLYLTAYSKISYKKKYFIPNKNLKSFYTNNFYYKIVDVKVLKLDTFKIKADIIKIDVEGFEYNVVLGAIKTIIRNKPILYIENPCTGIKILLRKMKYQQYYFNEKLNAFSIFNKSLDNRNFYFFYKNSVNYLI